MSLNYTPSFIAGGDVNPGRCVKISGADNQIIQCTAATDVMIGISRRAAADTPGLTGSDASIAARAGFACLIFGVGDVAPAVAGAAITRGVWLTSDASGRVITAPATANEGVIGVALESASGAGVEIQILVMPNRVGQL